MRRHLLVQLVDKFIEMIVTLSLRSTGFMCGSLTLHFQKKDLSFADALVRMVASIPLCLPVSLHKNMITAI